MSTFRVLWRNISWNYVEAAVSFVVYLLLTPIVVEQLGATGFGLWVLLKAILFYLKFLDLGFYNALVKYVAEHSERREWTIANGLIASTTSLLSIAGVVALVASALVAWLLLPTAFNVPADRIEEMQLATLLLGVDLLIAFPASVLSAIFEARQRFDVHSIVTVLATLVCAGATIICLKMGYGIVALAWIEIAGSLITATLFVLILRRLMPEIRLGWGSPGGPYFRRLRSYSTWTSLNEILAEGSTEVEKLLVPIVLSVSLLTPYTLICTVAAAIFLAVEPITETFFPLSAAYEAKGDKVRLRELLLRGTKLVMAISLPLAALVTAYGEAFILEWIGTENIEVPPGVLPLVVASFTITAFVLTATTILLALGMAKQVFWMGITELALAVTLVLLLVPSMGLPGLAGSLLIANALISLFWIVPYTCRLIEQSSGEFLAQSVMRPLLAIAPMALVIGVLESWVPGDSLPWLVAKSALAGMVYLVAFFSLSLTAQERQFCLTGFRALLGREPE